MRQHGRGDRIIAILTTAGLAGGLLLLSSSAAHAGNNTRTTSNFLSRVSSAPRQQPDQREQNNPRPVMALMGGCGLLRQQEVAGTSQLPYLALEGIRYMIVQRNLCQILRRPQTVALPERLPLVPLIDRSAWLRYEWVLPMLSQRFSPEGCFFATNERKNLTSPVAPNGDQ